MRILIACFAKSGSTYLSNQIAAQPGFKRAHWTPAYGRREQELDGALIASDEGLRVVAQHHVRASEHTLDLIDNYGISTVVLVRRLGDALASLTDHISMQDTSMPFAYFDDYFKQMEWSDRLNAVVDLAAPWYINFYVSWFRYRPGLIVRYEDVILNSDTSKIENLIGIKINYKNIADSSRFNVGIEGRGDQISEKLRKYMAYYPDVDFAPIL